MDDIDEVGPLNYDILEPVLQRAAPQTLIHIEDLNQRKFFSVFCGEAFIYRDL